MTEPRPPKAVRRDEAKAAAQRLREEQQRAARRQRTLAVGLLVAGIAVVGVIVAVILNQGGGDAAGAEEQPSVSSDRGAIVLDADGIVQPPDEQVTPGEDGEDGNDDDVVWPQGAFDDAVVVSVYSDYMCPFCGLFEESNGPLLEELRASGEIVLAMHPVAILDRYSAGTQFSTRATAAVFAVAEQAPEALIEFNALLFANQPEENSTGLSDEQIADLASQAGVPDDVVATLADGTYTWWAAQATDRASQDLGSLSTPTILLDGVPLAEGVDWRVEGALAEAIDAARG